MSNNDTNPLTVVNNQGFVDDEQNPPPPYSTVYLINSNSTNETTSNNNNHQGSYQINLSNSSPVSYEELFQSSNAPFFSNLVQNINEIRARNNQPPLYEANEFQDKSLVDSLHKFLPNSYLKRHFQVILVASILLIIFQMYLIEYRVMYSSLASGVWAGSFNLLTFIVSITMMKFAKEWLLVTSIMLHVSCIMFSLGGFIIINTIIATKPCYTELDRSRVCFISRFPLNISMVIIMIFLGIVSMVAFTIYLVKLIKVFNSVQSSK